MVWWGDGGMDRFRLASSILLRAQQDIGPAQRRSGLCRFLRGAKRRRRKRETAVANLQRSPSVRCILGLAQNNFGRLRPTSGPSYYYVCMYSTGWMHRILCLAGHRPGDLQDADRQWRTGAAYSRLAGSNPATDRPTSDVGRIRTGETLTQGSRGRLDLVGGPVDAVPPGSIARLTFGARELLQSGCGRAGGRLPGSWSCRGGECARTAGSARMIRPALKRGSLEGSQALAAVVALFRSRFPATVSSLERSNWLTASLFQLLFLFLVASSFKLQTACRPADLQLHAQPPPDNGDKEDLDAAGCSRTRRDPNRSPRLPAQSRRAGREAPD